MQEAHLSDKGLFSKIYKELLKLNSKNSNNLLKKWAKDISRHLTKEHAQVAYEVVPRVVSLGKCRIKQGVTTLGRVNKIGSSYDTESAMMWSNGSSYSMLVGMQTTQPRGKRDWPFCRKLNTILPYDPP